MSSYFDSFDERLSKTSLQQLGNLEEELIRDVGVCSELEGFPIHLRPELHRIILRYSVASRGWYVSGMENETEDGYRAKFSQMLSELRALFQTAKVSGFFDNPIAPLHYLHAKSIEYRESLYRSQALGDSPKCPECERMLQFRPTPYSVKFPWVEGFYINAHSWSCPKGCTGALWSEDQMEEYDRRLGFEVLSDPFLNTPRVRFLIARSLRADENVLGGFSLPEDEVTNINDLKPKLGEKLMDLLILKGRK